MDMIIELRIENCLRTQIAMSSLVTPIIEPVEMSGVYHDVKIIVLFSDSYRCPVRKKMLVENGISNTRRRPVRDGMWA
jgi:hypothetical protein